ncbi:MAG: TolC family protein [Bacteroidota bacterium]
MKLLNLCLVIGAVLLSVQSSHAQIQAVPQLSLSDVIERALEENDLIQIQRIETEIAENTATPGNAGYLPTLSLVSGLDYQTNNADLLLRTFQPNPPAIRIDESGVETTTFTAAFQVDYTLFDGFARKNRYRILKQGSAIANKQQEIVINQVIMDVTRLFYTLLDLQKEEELLGEIVETSEERNAKIQRRFDLGTIDGLTLLQARTNLNRDLLRLEEVRVARRNIRKDLAFLIGIEVDDDFSVQSTFRPIQLADYATLKNSILLQNPEIELAKQGIVLTKADLEAQKSSRYPRLSTFARLNYLNQTNDVQQIAEIETLGPQVGLSLQYALFTGGQNRIAIQNKRLSVKTAEQQQQLVLVQILTETSKEYETLTLLQTQLEKEQENLTSFQEAFNRTERRFLDGQATSIDFRDAQNALLDAELSISAIQSNVMLAFYRIQQLQGALIQ